MICGICGKPATLTRFSGDGSISYRCTGCAARESGRAHRKTIFNAIRESNGAAKKVASGDGLLTAAAVAAKLNVSKSTVLRLARRGEIKHLKMGRVLRFSTEGLEAYKRRSRRGL